MLFSDARLRLAISDLEDLTNLYPKIGVRFDEELNRLLQKDEVRLIRNAESLRTEFPSYVTMRNIFEPIVVSSGSPTALKEPADLVLTGSVQEIYFGDDKFDPGSLLLGVIGSSVMEGGRMAARVSIRIKVTTADRAKVLFEKTIQATHVGRDLERSVALDTAMKTAVIHSAYYLFRH